MKIPRWHEAMVEEVWALKANCTCMIATLPENKISIGYKWIYKIKSKAEKSIQRYKTCSVMKGFAQIGGLDFHETFAPDGKASERALSPCGCTFQRMETPPDGCK